MTRAGLFPLFLIAFLIPLCSQAQPPAQDAPRQVSDVTEQEDPYLWLEDVEGEEQLEWVRARNKMTQEHFESSEQFTELEADLLTILDSDERIPFVSRSGDYYYNFWRDKDHVRGIWRRTTLEEYRKDDPEWEVMLDLDAVAEAEDENWVWDGASILRPDYDLALVNLSRGGADANVTREFNLETGTFVEGGFERPEAKGGMSWIDRDSVFVYTDFGDESMTSSGYPRIAKLLRRGQTLDEAEVVYEGEEDDMYIAAMHDDSPGYERNFVSRTLAFYNDELYVRADDGGLTKIDAPNSANKSVFQKYLILELRKDWEIEDTTYKAGSLLVSDFDAFLAGERSFDIAFEPTETTSLAGFSPMKDHLVLNVLEDVKNRIYVLTPEGESWKKEPLLGAPEIGTVSVSPVDSDYSNEYWMTSSDYLNPTTLFYGEIGSEPEQLKQLTPMYDAEGLQVSQHFATSKDGTRIPYFMVARSDIELDGSNPTLLYGYGGFEISLTPRYSATVGRAWTSQGGVYVVANIRGGGEYGPRWHQAALKENRLRAYEDFAAVGEDLISRGVTSSRRLGIQGGSNGGLLVGNMVAIYPDLFEAAVCQVPLLDMRRYHLLLAGASWMAEYGNPDFESEWDFIQKYSPYQNIKEEVEYPAVLFTTSTRDDRVHPGHARKMMAMMEAQGHDVSYYENIEGGHGGAANNKQRAYMTALAYSYLRERLFAGEEQE
ncbi:MAG: prolyl oligopeptidase family serine peptidase [Planctomycetota bacterium]